MYPFYIPSIYRQDSEFLIKLRDIKPELKYYIIIAKHQYTNYAKYYDSSHLVVLPDNIIKISEIRQYILNLAIKNKEDKIWMSDDDLSNFFIRKKVIKKVDFLTFITKAEQLIDKITDYNKKIVQFGFKYSTFGLPKKQLTLNSNIGMIQLLNINAIKNISNIKYDTKLDTLEDTDFTIKLFENGFSNCVFNDLIFTAPKSGTGQGGLEKNYLEGAKQKGMIQFHNKYGDRLIKIINLEKGKYKINWSLFHNLEDEKKLDIFLK
jgi:hypothetical protein